MAKAIFSIMMFLVLIVIFVSMIIIQAKFHPEQDNLITRTGTQILNFLKGNKKLLKKIKSITMTILIVASVIGIAGFYIYTLPRNSKAENYVDEYIQNSTEVELFYFEPDEMQAMRQESQENYTTETYERHSGIIEKYHKHQTVYTGMRVFGSRAKLNMVNFNTIVFKDENSQKYFQIMYAARTNSQMFFFSALLRDGLRLMCRINKFDLENTALGTVENPIPILMFRIPKREGSKDYENEKITEEQYKNNVYCYFAYIMSKDEFKQRFENSEKDKPTLLTTGSNAQTDSTNIKTYYYDNCSVDSITIRHRDDTHNNIVSRKKDWDLILGIATTAVCDEDIDDEVEIYIPDLVTPDFTFFIHCSNGQKRTIIFWGGFMTIDGKWCESESFSYIELEEIGSRYK